MVDSSGMILPASDWLRVRWSHLKLGYLSSLTFNHCGVRGFALLAGLFMEGFSSEEHVSPVTRGWRLYNELDFFCRAEFDLISSQSAGQHLLSHSKFCWTWTFSRSCHGPSSDRSLRLTYWRAQRWPLKHEKPTNLLIKQRAGTCVVHLGNARNCWVSKMQSFQIKTAQGVMTKAETFAHSLWEWRMLRFFAIINCIVWI